MRRSASPVLFCVFSKGDLFEEIYLLVEGDVDIEVDGKLVTHLSSGGCFPL
jgi:hypothetical protein